MDQEESSSINESTAERRKSNAESDENEILATFAAVAPVRQRADIFKLDIDCFDEVFDFLPLGDLVSSGETCKRLQNVAGYFFYQNYSSLEAYSHSEGIGVFHDGHFDVTHFVPFIRKICISDLDGLQFVLSAQSKLRRLKKIKIDYIQLTPADIDGVKEILSKIEFLYLYLCDLTENFHQIIGHCTNLKRLELERCDINCERLIQNYPSLEYFSFRPKNSVESKGLMKILKLNPEIRRFTTAAECLWENREAIKNTTNIKLDDLAIEFHNDLDVKLFGSFCNLLNELHDHGVYKRLLVYIREIPNQAIVDQLSAVNGLAKLFSRFVVNDVALSKLDSLEEFYTRYSGDISDLETAANSLTNLKRFHFEVAQFEDIIPFIRRSVRLEKIRVDRFLDGIHFSTDTNIVDLPKLNRQRQQLADAQKITLYVEDDMYLATKWAFKETNFELICLKRRESHEWGHDFGWYTTI